MFKITPYREEVLFPSLRTLLKAFTVILLTFSSSGYGLTLRIYDVSQVPPSATPTGANPVLRAPLIQQIEISQLNQQGTWGRGYSLSSYTVEARQVRSSSNLSIQRPDEPCRFHTKTLKQSSQPKPDDPKKKKKEKKKKGASPENFCSSYGQNPLFLLFGSTHHKKYDLIIKDGGSQESQYKLEARGTGVFHPSRPTGGPPTEFVSEVNKIENKFGRYSWHPYTEIQDDLAYYSPAWTYNLMDVLLGIDCRFKIIALIAARLETPHLAMVLGYELILDPQPDAPNGLHLFIQAELPPIHPATIVLTNAISNNEIVAGSDIDIQLATQMLHDGQDQDYTEMHPLTDQATASAVQYHYVDNTGRARQRSLTMGISAGSMQQVHLYTNCRSGQPNFHQQHYFPPPDGGGGSSGGFYSAP